MIQPFPSKSIYYGDWRPGMEPNPYVGMRFTELQHKIVHGNRSTRCPLYKGMYRHEFNACQTVIMKNFYWPTDFVCWDSPYRRMLGWNEGDVDMTVVIWWSVEKRFEIIERKFRPTDFDLRGAMDNVLRVERIWADPRPAEDIVANLIEAEKTATPEPPYVPSEQEAAAKAAQEAQRKAEARADLNRRLETDAVLQMIEKLKDYMITGQSLRRGDPGLDGFLISTQAKHMKILKLIDGERAREIGSILSRVDPFYAEAVLSNWRHQIEIAAKASRLWWCDLAVLRDDLARLLPAN